ncbi:MAG: hypothetical protein LH631_09030 [Alkalinema sp. CAN_BIN05]|nr:hypothetical protein [Alkalinema sp. CAN_BIN05]
MAKIPFNGVVGTIELQKAQHIAMPINSRDGHHYEDMLLNCTSGDVR